MPHALRVTDQAVAHTIRSLGSVVSLDRQGRVRSTHVGTGATAADGTFPYADPAIPAIVVRAGWSGSVGADGIAAGIAQLFGPSGAEPFRTHQGAAEYTWGSWLASRDIYLLMDQDYRIEARGREDGELIWRSPLTDSVSLDRISPYSDTLLLTPLDSAPRLVEFNAEGAAESQFDLPGSSQMRATDVVWLPDGDQMLVIFDYTLIARGSRGTRTMQWIGRLMTPIQELTVAGDGQSLAWQLRAQRGVPPTVFSSIDVLPPNNEPAPPAGEGPFDLGQIADLPVIELGEPTTAANVVMALGGQSRFALFTFGEGVKLGGLDQDEEVLFEGVAMATATSEDGKQLVLVDTRPIVGRQSFLFAGSPTFGERQQRQTIITFDVGPGQAEEASRVEWVGGLVRDIDFGADGWVLFCEDYGVELETLAGPQAGKRLRLGRHAAFVSQLVALPGNRWVTGSFDHSVQVWDGETGQSLGTAWELDASVIALEPSPDGRRLAIAAASGQLLLVDADRPDQPAVEVELSDEPRRLLWRENGQLVAILKSGDWIEVSSTGQIQAEKKLGGGSISSVVVSPDQRFLAWIASEAPPMPIPGLPPGPQRLFLAAIDDLEGRRGATDSRCRIDGAERALGQGRGDRHTVGLSTTARSINCRAPDLKRHGRPSPRSPRPTTGTSTRTESPWSARLVLKSSISATDKRPFSSTHCLPVMRTWSFEISAKRSAFMNPPRAGGSSNAREESSRFQMTSSNKRWSRPSGLSLSEAQRMVALYWKWGVTTTDVR
ncbi:MAG: hypothetical protein R3B96_03465 [Pirellulaceae bacterium]